MLSPSASVEPLWHDYVFLTREILKFTHKKNLDMVLELLVQREKIQQLLDQTPDPVFLSSAAGQALLQEIQHNNRFIENTLTVTHNQAKRTHQVSDSYDTMGRVNTGVFMDRKS